MRRIWISAVLIFVLNGCVQYARPFNVAESADYQPLPVYFATNRINSKSENLNQRYGKQRSALKYGIGTVSIPSDYPQAQQEGFIHWNLTLRRNPKKDLAVLNYQTLNSHRYFQQLNQSLEQSDSGTLLFFVHGFNLSFEKIVRTSAKMAYDLEIDGAVTVFSWPSENNPTRYSADEGNLIWSQPDLDWYLDQLFQQTNAKRVIFMAHSLGNRALVRALIRHFNRHPENIGRTEAIVLMAPDIDRDVFSRDLAPELTQFGIPIGLYTSSRDLALGASHSLHNYPRAGEAGQGIVLVDGIDTIDASESEAEFFGHEYYAQGPQTISDLYQWLIEGKTPSQRQGLELITTDRGNYWQILPISTEGLP